MIGFGTARTAGSDTDPIDVRSEVHVFAPRPLVFELLTTPALWPSWHTATRAIAGIGERPYELGDKFEERATVADRAGSVHWKCVAHAPPVGATIEAEQVGMRIAYALSDAGDQSTVIRRRLTVDRAVVAGFAESDDAAAALLERISRQSFERFRALAYAMHRGLPLPVP